MMIYYEQYGVCIGIENSGTEWNLEVSPHVSNQMLFDKSAVVV